MAARTEVLREGTISGKKTVSVARRLEPLHALLALDRSRALQFVGDNDPRYVR